MKAIQADVTVDALGQYCPMPIILASKAIRKMALGQVLEVLSDDPGIQKDMPAWCRSTRNEFLGIVTEGKVFRAYVRKTAEGA